MSQIQDPTVRKSWAFQDDLWLMQPDGVLLCPLLRPDVLWGLTSWPGQVSSVTVSRKPGGPMSVRHPSPSAWGWGGFQSCSGSEFPESSLWLLGTDPLPCFTRPPPPGQSRCQLESSTWGAGDFLRYRVPRLVCIRGAVLEQESELHLWGLRWGT